MRKDSTVSDSGQLRNLLVVEDNPGDTRLVREAFKESELETTLHTVATGESALDFVYRRGTYEDAPRPDALLLDWSLPKMDGKAVLGELKTEFPDTPVVVMSGSNPRKEAVESMTSRADAYLTKPTEPEVYIDAVRSLATVDTTPELEEV